MGRRGQIAIDRIVALRSSVLPIYVLIRPDGTVTAADEVSEDGNDFLTTRMFGDQIAFQSIHGDYLSTEGGAICTRRYCSADERFTVEKLETQYAFRSRTGAYLSVSDRAPFVGLASQAGDTEVFQLFSLMMYGVNVGQQLDMIDRTGCIQINDLLSSDDLQSLREGVAEANGFALGGGHETRVHGLAGCTQSLADLATHPLVMQIARRLLSPAMQLASMESCRTDVDHVRKELEVTTWNVVYPYSRAMFPGVVDPRANFTVTWFLDQLDAENSTWAFVKAPLSDGTCTPQLPHLSSPGEVEAVTSTAQHLLAQTGSAWLCIGPYWMSNNVGAASFWKDYDAQTRYKHLSGQKDAGQSFRALTDAQRSAPLKDEMCPTVIQATYLRENTTLRDLAPSPHVLATYGEAGRQLAELTMSAPTA
eukprot:TRINITY_DN14137_c0_g2_i1.p1 TRINITY_DN14137_c0_g2~~TRINITY_DN14137_c0_g2_i1.p1  ORF type:complete len:431 (-),score=59.62 TRINITY_DN14137_c0_g2_i1:199-1461(-)